MKSKCSLRQLLVSLSCLLAACGGPVSDEDANGADTDGLAVPSSSSVPDKITSQAVEPEDQVEPYSTERSVRQDLNACMSWNGHCTGFGTRQCVKGLYYPEPGSPTVEHCCSGWFQYPWIEACSGSGAKAGCGFCLW